MIIQRYCNCAGHLFQTPDESSNMGRCALVRCLGAMVARRPPKAKVAGSNPVGSIGLHFLPDSNMFVWKNDKPINQQSQVVLWMMESRAHPTFGTPRHLAETVMSNLYLQTCRFDSLGGIFVSRPMPECSLFYASSLHSHFPADQHFPRVYWNRRPVVLLSKQHLGRKRGDDVS